MTIDPGSLLGRTISSITPTDSKALAAAEDRQCQLTKPPGSLGLLEVIGCQLSAICGQVPPPVPTHPVLAVFAGDHGVYEQNITSWPQEVTVQMLINMCYGGASINALAPETGTQIWPVDIGVANGVPDAQGLRRLRGRSGTADFTQTSAMTREEAQRAIEVGIALADQAVAGGADVLLTGEVGLGNTTSASALIAAMTGTDPQLTTGRGAGSDDVMLQRKVDVVRRGIALHDPDPSDPLGVLAAAYLGLCAYATLSGTIYPNTTVGGVDYGGMTEEQAAAELTRRVIDAQSARLDFAVMEGDSCEVIAGVALGDIPADIDCRKAADTLARVRSAKGDGFFKSGAGFLFSLFTEHEESIVSEEPFCAAAEPVLDALECEPVEFAIALTTESAISVTKSRDGRHIPDREQARRVIGDALRGAYLGGGCPLQVTLYGDPDAEASYETVPAQAVDLAAEREKLVGEKVNASYDIENEKIIPSHAGVSFTLADLQSAYDAAAPGETFTVRATVERPEVTTEQLEAGLFRDELSSYTTRVGGAPGRHKNVKLTAERITGYILNAGDTMKYGPLVTPFTAENGYSPAPGYLNGKTVDMIGGGACQASSTLYAAVLYANLEIVQRVNHGYASDYIGLGLDATVASGGPEFEFRNNTLYPIKVQADFFTKDKKDYIKITLLGTKTDDHYVKIVTELISTTPYEEELVETDTLAPGEQKVEQTPYTGYVVKTYRNVYAGDGTLLSSTYEATSRYKSRNRIILVGKAADAMVDPNVPAMDPTVPGSDPGVPTTDPGATMTDPGVPDVDPTQTPAIPETPQTSETAPAA